MKLANYLILALALLGAFCWGFVEGTKYGEAGGKQMGHVAGYTEGFNEAITGGQAVWANVCFKSHEFTWRKQKMWCGPVHEL